MKTIDEIYQAMLYSFQQRAGFSPPEASDFSARLYAVAGQIQTLYAQSDLILNQSLPQTAQGIWLDYHAQMRGLSRNPGESDESLRTRILGKLQQKINGANAAWYEQAAMSHSGVTAVQVVSRARGIGTVNVYIATKSGLPTSALLQEVRTDLQEKREIAVDVLTLAPSVRRFNVSVSLIVQADTDFDVVKGKVEQAIRGFFSGQLLGKPLLRAELGNCISSVEGVESYSILSPNADQAAKVGDLPLLGTLTITNGGA